jgi:hypothetical protein
MTSAIRQVLAKQPFVQKLLQVSHLVASAQVLKETRLSHQGDYVKERDAVYSGKTVNSFFEQASDYQTN